MLPFACLASSIVVLNFSNTNKNEIMKSEENDNNDLREMDAADTLVALANTPTNEYKSNNSSIFNI